jgi:CRISPR-associated endonuclease/helicase Cas3
LIQENQTNDEFIAHVNFENKIQTCSGHCKNTACISAKKLEKVELRNTAYLAGLLHDAGKYSNEFRDYILKASAGEKVSKGSVIHSFAGCSYLLKMFHGGDLGYSDVATEIIAYAIGAHHGLFDLVNEDGSLGFDHRLIKQSEYDQKAMNHFFDECSTRDEVKILFNNSVNEITKKINAIIELANSNDETLFYCGLLARLVLSAVIDGDRLDTFSFMSGQSIESYDAVEWGKYVDNVDDYINKMPSDTIIQKARRELSDFCMQFAVNDTDIYQINIPTGSGKTLSGLRYALHHAHKYGKTRIFYVAPLISILEQNAKVIRNAVGDDEIVLEHHSNLIIDNDSETNNEISGHKLLTENWDSPIVVTTLVQFLNTLFAGKTSQIRRFSSLVNSVVILDEVQSVPWKMLSLFNLTINFLSKVCNTTVLLCSATQPSFDLIEHKMMFSSKSIIPEEKTSYYFDVFRRNKICFGGKYRLDEMTGFLHGLMAECQSLLVVCNKKMESEYLYHELMASGYDLFHLSAAMCMAHREEMMKKMQLAINEKHHVICVATQVVEAGVDVSFQTVVRFEAGIDNIIQAGGRCNRNGEYDVECKTYIVECIDESLIKLEEIRNAQSATKELVYEFDKDNERFENDLSSGKSIEYYYHVLYRNLSSRAGYFDYSIKDYPTLFSLMSGNEQYRKDTPKYFLNQAFRTAGNLFQALDQNTVSLVVPFGDGKAIITELCSEKIKYDLKKAKSILQKAKRYSVSVMINQVKDLIQRNLIYGIYDNSVYALREEYYDENTGFIVRKEESDKCNILIL